jgi:hypothetical protein
MKGIMFTISNTREQQKSASSTRRLSREESEEMQGQAKLCTITENGVLCKRSREKGFSMPCTMNAG